MLVLFLVGFIPHLNLKDFFIYFFILIIRLLKWEWGDLNPKYLYWKHQERPIELQSTNYKTF